MDDDRVSIEAEVEVEITTWATVPVTEIVGEDEFDAEGAIAADLLEERVGYAWIRNEYIDGDFADIRLHRVLEPTDAEKVAA